MGFLPKSEPEQVLELFGALMWIILLGFLGVILIRAYLWNN